jgi:membrane-associated phospholipid phosphatase
MLYRILIVAGNASFYNKVKGVLAVLLLMANTVYAGNRVSDTANVSIKNRYLIKNGLIRKGIAPALFFAGSALTWKERESVRDARNRYIPNFSNNIDDYMQYMPTAGVLALNLAGKKGLNRLSRAAVNWGTGMLIMGITVNSVKYLSGVMRPDNTSANSFPSGHTATAFMNASFLNKEFGCRSAAYGIAGYAMSTFTGVERALNNRHWISDILAGAGIGILSTELAYLIVNRLYKNRGDYIADSYSRDLYRTTENYSHISAHVGYSVYFDKRTFYPAGTATAIEGFYYFRKNWGAGGKIIFSHCPFRNESMGIDIYDVGDIQIENPQTNIQSAGMFDFLAGTEYTLPLGSKFLMQIKAMAGLAAGVKGEASIEGTTRDKNGNPVPVNISLLEYRPFPAFTCSTGIAFTGMMASHVGLSLFIDCKHSSPVFEFKSSPQISTQQRHTERIPVNSLSAGLRLTAFFN